ncbi:serine hydrolase domain-containing protein [Leeuwenhoekiella polynyae]|uniref:CubicO group peptidase (Beta-lactamase class C family) n=1 Tax=Leeuwenhoekiella polynyae TaxID=1550906 RepID=A0A4Q0NYG7_9FLAO|nr:serine hydrolase [Leeuwenhoekiella polynyae]RXG16362.1 CubicO group peptidase (beta-lactamase class C family) [Leeuwenhoekiella polynyae]
MNYFRLLLLSVIWCCSWLSFEVAAQEVYFPAFGARWETPTKTDNAFSEESLQKAVDFALAHEYSGSRDLRQAILKGFEREPYHEILGPTKKRGGPAGMILKNGYLVTSWGDTQRVDITFSVTKSFLSTTAGLAVAAGIIPDVNDPVSRTIWDGTFEGDHNSKITWKHLLEQNSDWSGQLWGGKDWADRPPREGNIDAWKNRELQEPGTFFEYNDVRVNVLAYALTQTWRKPLPQVLKEQIMDPIGASTTWRWFGYDQAWTTIDGLHMQSVTGGGHSGGGMFISAEDMARFGLLFLNNGIWNGKRLLSENWVNAVQQPSAPNPNYGYMWWLNQPGPRHWENLPEHLYYAAGFGGNFIVIDQENDLVLVLRWLEPGQIEAFLELVYGVK